jgi:serine phosphatase RsbU (regulator of sigma subunit)
MQSSFDTVSWFLTVFSVAALVLLLLSAFAPESVVGSDGILPALITRILGLASTVVTAGVIGFLVALLRARPSMRIRAYLITQAVLLSIIFLGGLISVTSEEGVVVVLLAAISSSIMTLGNAPRLPWLQTLPLSKKLRLLWLTGCAAFASILMIVVYVQFDTILSVSTATLVGGMNLSFGAIMIVALVVFLRLIASVLISLPNSTIVDRRSLEIESLATLARLTAQSGSMNDVLARTTELAVRVTQAHGAWAELGVREGAEVVATQHVHADYVRSLHQNQLIRQVIADASSPVVVDSLAEYGVDTRALAIRSMVIIPIAVDGARCATLVAFMTADFGFHPDDHRLLAAFGDILSIAIEQSRLHASVLEQERLQKEADVAREIQTSLLPRLHPRIEGIDLYGIMVPASEVGGDYFDYVRFADGSFGVVIADVAGKGIPAALYMATLKGAVLAEVREASGPADLLHRLSLTLSGQMDKRSYITMSCVQFQPSTSSLRYARAGHSPMIIKTSTGVDIVRPKGVAIGIVPPETFRTQIEEVELHLVDGDVCLLTTDGVTERRNESMQEMGIAAINALLLDTAAHSAKDIVEQVQQQLDHHAQGADAHDDVTIVAIRACSGSSLLQGQLE